MIGLWTCGKQTRVFVVWGFRGDNYKDWIVLGYLMLQSNRTLSTFPNSQLLPPSGCTFLRNVVTIYQTAKGHFPQDRNPDIHGSGNPTNSWSVSNFKCTICKHIASICLQSCINLGRKWNNNICTVQINYLHKNRIVHCVTIYYSLNVRCTNRMGKLKWRR